MSKPCCYIACKESHAGQTQLSTFEMKDAHAGTHYFFCGDCVRLFVDLGLPFRRIGFGDWVCNRRQVAATAATAATFPVEREPVTENSASQAFLF